MKINVSALILTLIMMVSLAACGTYYQVTDPSSDKVYYTEKINKKSNGAIEFKDSATGKEIIIQNSEVIEVDKDAYEAGMAEPAPAPEPEAEPAAEAMPEAEAEPTAEAEPATEAEPAAETEPTAEAEPAAE